MRRIVLFLATEIPCHERDALQSCLALFHSLVVRPVTHNDPNGGYVVMITPVGSSVLQYSTHKK